MNRPRSTGAADPLAARAGLRIRPYRPLRALIGGGIVVACVLAGWALIVDAATKHDVLVLTREVQAGEQIEASDVRVLSITWDETFPAFAAAELDSVVGEYARYRLARNAVLVPDDVQERPLVRDGRVLMSVSVPSGAIPTSLRADSRVWLIASQDIACAGTTVVIDAVVVRGPSSVGAGADADADETSRSVAVSVEVLPAYVAAVGAADAISIALWARDEPPPVPSPTGEGTESCPVASDSASLPGSGSAEPGAPPTTGTFLIDGSDIIIPPTSTSITP